MCKINSTIDIKKFQVLKIFYVEKSIIMFFLFLLLILIVHQILFLSHEWEHLV
jgi:hypothetical protein